MPADHPVDPDCATRTPDGHHVLIGGRKWRACDPQIPDRLRAQLVAELMAARRAVRTVGDGARARVHDAKLALGERGEPWWDEPTPQGRQHRLGATMRALLRHRDPASSICPSDAARVVGGTSWRTVLPDARAVAGQLQDVGLVTVTQGVTTVDPRSASGPVRIRRGERWPDD